MKFLIAGLGNPGSKYENTRHNIGFKILDALAEAANTEFSIERHGERAQFVHRGKTLVLLKPSTFMNLSGKAINYWLQKDKIQIEHLLIVSDDISLPLGKLRLKGKGSHGGHNGLRSIQEILGTSNFSRLRFGIGNNFYTGQQVEHVLGEWEDIEYPIIQKKLAVSNEMIESFCSIGLDRTMNIYNNK